MFMTTDIVVTIGPTSDGETNFKKLVKAGMTIARNNFSHCKHDEFKARVAMIRRFNKQTGANIKILADLQGPRIRVGQMPESGLVLKPRQVVTFISAAGKNKKDDEIYIDDPYLHADVSVDDPILLSSGAIELRVTKTMPKQHRFQAEVIVGGVLYSRKGVNLPTTKLTTNSLTEKDLTDLKFILKTGTDYIALSFVQDAKDILRVKKAIGRLPVKVIAKIERREALKNLDEIIDAADGIMVARGDLGVEIPYAEVPIMQKAMIRKCHLRLKPAIVATQMLSSMVDNPFPTRAEVSDVANAVFDGAHAVMLSDETANGQYPIESVNMMRQVVEKAEEYLEY